MMPTRSGVLGLLDQRRILRDNHSLTGEPERARLASADQSSNGRRRSSVASQGSIANSLPQLLQNSRLLPTADDAAAAANPGAPLRQQPAASDAMCVSNALIGLVAATIQTSFDLEDINFAPRKSTACINRALGPMRSLKPTTQLMYKWMRRFEYRTLQRADRAGMIELDILIVLLAEAILAVSELGNLLVDVVREAAAAISEIAETVPAYAGAIIEVTDRIVRVEALMSKVLTIWQISSDAEALKARSVIDNGIAHILQDNVSLAERIRSLEDIFGARALVPQERHAKILNQPPPGYSVPTPRAEVLPDYTAEAPRGGLNADGSITIRPIGWSIFSGLTLEDVRILSLIPVPLVSGELRYGDMYSFEYSRSVDLRLGNLMEQYSKEKVKKMLEILGIRQAGLDEGLEAADSFSKRVGMDMYSNMPTSDLVRRRPRPQPNTIVGGLV